MPKDRLEAFIALVDRSRKRLIIALIAALLLHMPFTPAAPMVRLLRRFIHFEETPAAKVKLTPPPPREVEVELREALRSDVERQEQALLAKPSNASSLSLGMPKPTPSPVKFAQGEASRPPPKPEEPAAKPEPPKKPKIKQVGLEGKVKGDIRGRPNVTIGVWFPSFRDHPLGGTVGKMLTCDPEWRSFVQQGIDPLRDFEGVLVVGPNVRESGKMTAAVRHHLPPEQVKSVVGALVTKSGPKGHWLTPDAAQTRLGKVDRVLLPHQSDMFFVTPPEGYQGLADAKSPLRVPNAEGRSASVALRQPASVLKRAGLSLPDRLGELRLEVFTNPDQSLDVRVELDDSSAETAKDDAPRISRQMHDFFADIWMATSTLGSLTGAGPRNAPSEVAPRLDLVADEKTLVGMIHLSPAQTKTTLDLLVSLICRGKTPPTVVPTPPPLIVTVPPPSVASVPPPSVASVPPPSVASVPPPSVASVPPPLASGPGVLSP